MAKIIEFIVGFLSVIPLLGAVTTILIDGQSSLSATEFTLLSLATLIPILSIIVLFKKDFLTD